MTKLEYKQNMITRIGKTCQPNKEAGNGILYRLPGQLERRWISSTALPVLGT